MNHPLNVSLNIAVIFSLISVISCNTPKEKTSADKKPIYLTCEQAENLAQLPMSCIQNEYPNKPGMVLGGTEDLGEPSELHPAFYGCFDWHSAVHGHWSLVKLLKEFPELNNADSIKEHLAENISEKNIEQEVEYFKGEHNESFERTYGWAWLLKLAEEIHTWDDPIAGKLEKNLQPLTNIIIQRYMEYIPKLLYPIRIGEHENTAFGLTFAWDYAHTTNNDTLKEVIKSRAKDYYLKDMDCPIEWEPGGHDFLSPCLEEIDLMRRVLNKEEFDSWISDFMPELKDKDFELETGEVSDRTDGKLVHLDGLNFSRAWVLYGLAKQYPEYKHLVKTANKHVKYSLPNLVDDSYEGGHWLGSFAIYALTDNMK
ncbi:MAG: DUF2891 domain-containing protein [Bacteroidales bacterium]